MTRVRTLAEALARIDELEEELAAARRQFRLDADVEALNVFARQFTLTRTQARILKILFDRHGRLVARDTLMDALYRECDDEPYAAVIGTFICYLRKRLEKVSPIRWIVTRPGLGYGLTEEGLELCAQALGHRPSRDPDASAHAPVADGACTRGVVWVRGA